MVILFQSPLTKFENELRYSYCKVIQISTILRTGIYMLLSSYWFFSAVSHWTSEVACDLIAIAFHWNSQCELCTNLYNFTSLFYLPFLVNIFILLFFSGSNCICSPFLIVQFIKMTPILNETLWNQIIHSATDLWQEGGYFHLD